MAQIVGTPRNDNLVGTSATLPAASRRRRPDPRSGRLPPPTHLAKPLSPLAGHLAARGPTIARRIEELEARRVLCNRQWAEQLRPEVRQLTFELEELKQAILAAEVLA